MLAGTGFINFNHAAVALAYLALLILQGQIVIHTDAVLFGRGGIEERVKGMKKEVLGKERKR